MYILLFIHSFVYFKQFSTFYFQVYFVLGTNIRGKFFIEDFDEQGKKVILFCFCDCSLEYFISNAQLFAFSLISELNN